MSSMDRPMSFLPTIKCSSCGVDIEISQLADHVCGPTSRENAEIVAPKPKLDRAATFGDSRSNQSSLSTSGMLRPGRAPPLPRIDPNAASEQPPPGGYLPASGHELMGADKPFQPNSLPSATSNYGDPNTYSPLSPNNGRTPWKLNRSVTSPMPPPLSPPSPDLPSNLDCAFPPFPSPHPGTSSGAGAGTTARDKLSPISTSRPPADGQHSYAPLSPRSTGGASVLKKLNSISPGPFDGRGLDTKSNTAGRAAPATNGGAAEAGHKRSTTQSSIYSNGNELSPGPFAPLSSLSHPTRSNGDTSLPSRPKPDVVPPPRPPRTEGIDAFLNRLQKETMQPSQIRSKTFPVRKGSGDAVEPTGAAPFSRPSEPSSLSRRPSEGSDAMKSKPANMFPVRSSSRAGSRTGIRPDEVAPPVPQLSGLEKGLGFKALHTPSDSGISDDSTMSSGFRSNASSRSSPATSASGFSRVHSKASRIDSPTEDDIPRHASPESFLDPRPAPLPEIRAGPVGFNRGNAPEPLLEQRPMPPFAEAPESPLDPAIQRGLLHQQRPSTSQASKKPLDADFSKSPPKQTLNPEPRAPLNRRPTAAFKGKCRGCSEPITGKSIKAADGRLTGRYHKQCFVCQTCRAPFQTADFYVFNNFPYCEQHYHQLNGSLCTSCNRGIEGTYLETDQRQKFHPKCFTCSVCRVVLRDDYFELGGKPYCERHAFYASAQQNSFLGPGGPGRRNPERRKTRLMMMM